MGTSMPLRRSRRVVAVVVSLVVAVLGLPLVGAPEATAYPGAPWLEPGKPYTGNFPDPHIVRDGGVYYAYATTTGGAVLPVMSSTDLVTWTPRPAYAPPAGPGCDVTADPYYNNALPCRPSWPGGGRNVVWAPGVAKLPNGSWVAYYAYNEQCLSVAVASSPIGPFVDSTTAPLWCDEEGGSIDPVPFVDDDGSVWLLWKSNGVPGSQPTKLWSRRMTADGRGFAPGSVRNELLRTASPWEGNVIENPTMVRWDPDGAGPAGRQLYLGWSANEWASPDYRVGVATCSSPVGGCTRRSGPLLANTSTRWSLAGGNFFVDAGGRLRMSYHWWNPPYSNYPTNPNCDGPGRCTSQGQRRLGIAALLPSGAGLTADPVGSVDSASASPGAVRVTGWAMDADRGTAATTVHVYVDGTFRAEVPADLSRPDVAALFPGYGDRHGFTVNVTGVAEGTRTVCVYGIAVAPHTTGNTLLGCRTVTVPSPPPPPIPPGPVPPLVSGAGFNPLSPARILDTRDGTGFDGGPARAGWTIPLDVTGRGGTPDEGVSGVLLNVTVTGPAAGGHVTVHPCGVPRPNASSLNYEAGTTIANLVPARVGSGGSVCLYATARTDLVADVVGWWDDTGAGDAYHPLQPARLMDTRDGTGGPATPLVARVTRDLQVAGRGGVPADATAVVVTVTVTGPASGGWLVVWPAGTARPVASTLNFGAGQTIANLASVRLGAGGKISLYANTGTHVVVDVVGYHHPGAGLRFTPTTPERILDTRNGTGGYATPWGPAQQRDLTVHDRGGVPGDAVAVMMNLTATVPTAGSFATIWPAGTSRPVASVLNWVPGQTIPGLVVTGIGTGGAAAVYNNRGHVHLIADVVGWYR